MNTYGPLSACGHGCLPRPGTVPVVALPVRALRVVALLGVLATGLAVAAAMPFLTAGGRLAAKRTWFRALLRASGVRMVVRGDCRFSAGQGTLVVANHVSWLDIPALQAVESMHIVAKADVRRWPVLGLLAARGGTVFIDQYRLRSLPGTVADMAAVLRSGHSVVAFPEGTTWCGRTQGRFYTATFQAAIDAGAPVRPVSLRYRLADGSPTTAAAFVGEDRLLASIMRVVGTRGLVVELEVGRLASTHGEVRENMAANAAATIRGSAQLVSVH